jgi:hypothetical protein
MVANPNPRLRSKRAHTQAMVLGLLKKKASRIALLPMGVEAWYLGCTRIASHAGVCPLTCEKAEGGSVSYVGAITTAIAATVAAAKCTTALCFAPSRRGYWAALGANYSPITGW